MSKTSLAYPQSADSRRSSPLIVLLGLLLAVLGLPAIAGQGIARASAAAAVGSASPLGPPGPQGVAPSRSAYLSSHKLASTDAAVASIPKLSASGILGRALNSKSGKPSSSSTGWYVKDGTPPYNEGGHWLSSTSYSTSGSSDPGGWREDCSGYVSQAWDYPAPGFTVSSGGQLDDYAGWGFQYHSIGSNGSWPTLHVGDAITFYQHAALVTAVTGDPNHGGSFDIAEEQNSSVGTIYLSSVTEAMLQGDEALAPLYVVTDPGLVTASAPLAPTGLKSTAITKSSVSLSWTASTGATSYQVENASTGAVLASPTGTTYTASGLSAKTSYSFAVRAVSSAGSSPYSGAITVTTTANSPVVSSLTPSATTIPTAGASLQLTAVASDATSYAFSYSSSPTSAPALSGLPATVASSTGNATVKVTVPANAGAAASYKFSVTATGPGGSSSAFTTTVAQSGGQLVELHSDGSIWQYLGLPCSSATSCTGWIEIDGNPAAKQVVTSGGLIYERHSDGSVYQYTGTGCSNQSTGLYCPGWVKLDTNPNTKQIVAGNGTVYELHTDGSIWQYTGTPCSATACPSWLEIDGNPAATQITAAATGGAVYELHSDGSIYQYTGTGCSNQSTGLYCPGWVKLDMNPNAKQISAGNGTVYQWHSDGSIWQYTGTQCSATACPGWLEVDGNPAGTQVVAGSGGVIYEMHSDGSIWQHTGGGCSNLSTGLYCPGWAALDVNPLAKQISAANGTVYQLHSDGKIFQYTGPACSGSTEASCTGWSELDSNPNATAIAS